MLITGFVVMTVESFMRSIFSNVVGDVIETTVGDIAGDTMGNILGSMIFGAIGNFLNMILQGKWIFYIDNRFFA